jgi:hypothetical protein
MPMFFLIHVGSDRRRNRVSTIRRRGVLPLVTNEELHFYLYIYTYIVAPRLVTRYWVTTAKQTKGKHPLLGNRFLISKYTQTSLSNAFANIQVPMSMSPRATRRKLPERRFLRSPCRDIRKTIEARVMREKPKV